MTSNVKLTFFQDRKLSFSCFCSKKDRIFVFGTKFWIETKRFLSVLENLGSNAFVLVRFQIIFETIKSFVLSLKNPGAIWNVWVSFCYHFLKIQTCCFDSLAVWSKQKRSDFVPIISGPNQNVLVSSDNKLRYRNVCPFILISLTLLSMTQGSGSWIQKIVKKKSFGLPILVFT